MFRGLGAAIVQPAQCLYGMTFKQLFYLSLLVPFGIGCIAYNLGRRKQHHEQYHERQFDPVEAFAVFYYFIMNGTLESFFKATREYPKEVGETRYLEADFTVYDERVAADGGTESPSFFYRLVVRSLRTA